MWRTSCDHQQDPIKIEASPISLIVLVMFEMTIMSAIHCKVNGFQVVHFLNWTLGFHWYVVRDDPKLLDDNGEILKSQGRGWRFDSRLWNVLSTWHKTRRVVNCLMCFDIGLSTFYLNREGDLIGMGFIVIEDQSTNITKIHVYKGLDCIFTYQ